MSNEMDIATPMAPTPMASAPMVPAPSSRDGVVHIEARAAWGGFHAGLDAGVTYEVDRHGEMLHITARRHGHFNAHYTFTIELPVEMIREAIGEE